MALWYYGTPDGQRGPVEEDELRGLIASGAVNASTLVWREGMENWQALQFVPGLGGQISPYLPGNAALAGGVPGYYQAVPTSGLAIASMVCGILGFLTCVTGIPAVICGHMALSRINAAPFSVAGRGMAIAGLVMGYLCILGLLFYAGLMIFVFSAAAAGGHSHHSPI